MQKLSPVDHQKRRPDRRLWSRLAGAVIALIALTMATGLLLLQANVTDETTGSTRTCGSAFDGVVDRSGWESWWVADLDDPDAAVRTSLLRTRRCPGAINGRIAGSGATGALGLLMVGFVAWSRPDRHRRSTRRGAGEELKTLGVRTTVAGLALTSAGVVALIVLLADSDSTLFLYTDRLVVGVVGLLVLVPPIALLIIGRSLSIMSGLLNRRADAS